MTMVFIYHVVPGIVCVGGRSASASSPMDQGTKCGLGVFSPTNTLGIIYFPLPRKNFPLQHVQDIRKVKRQSIDAKGKILN